MRTTLDIDDPVLRELKELQTREGKSLGRLVSDLLARAEGGCGTHCLVAPGLDRKADGRTRQSLRQGSRVPRPGPMTTKAWLALLGETSPLTHNLDALLNLLAGRGVTAEPFRKLIAFTPYADEFRYEGVDSNTEPINWGHALALVDALL